jgi:phage tail sheath protein FI
MPATLTYPGVYIQEIPSGSRTITGVATAVAAFVGRASRGPVDEPVRITSLAEFERTFGGLERTSGLGYAVRDFYLNGGNLAVVVRLGGEGAAAATIVLGEEDDDEAVTLTTIGPGTWGNDVHAEVVHAPAPPADAAAAANHPTKVVADQQGVDPGDLFMLTIREGPEDDPLRVETYPNVTLVDGPRRIDTVLGASTLVRVAEEVTLPGEGRPDEDSYDATGGVDSPASLALTDYVDSGFAEAKAGIYALLDADLFTLLCLPPSAPDLAVPDALWSDALALCADRRAFLIVDPPPDTGADDIEDWVTDRGLTALGRNGAVYFPRVRRPDPLRDGAVGTFVPSGAVAGIMARTDGARGVWKAPAGIEAGIVGASGLSVQLTDDENGELNPVGINCLRTFAVIGSVVWGARTLRGADVLADEYRYVPVRRLALFLEETLYRSTQWVVFEPNDEPLWAQIRTSIGAFMQDLFRQGAFQGLTPRDAYFVRCDAETTTQYDIDRGIVNIIVGFAPLKPAEFVVVSIQQKTATAQA